MNPFSQNYPLINFYSQNPNQYFNKIQTPRINSKQFKENQIVFTVPRKNSEYSGPIKPIQTPLIKHNCFQFYEEIKVQKSLLQPIQITHNYNQKVLEEIQSNKVRQQIVKLQGLSSIKGKHTKCKTDMSINNKMCKYTDSKESAKSFYEKHDPQKLCQMEFGNKKPQLQSKISFKNLQNTKVSLDKTLKIKDFQKIKNLGKGKFGQVYLVRHRKSNFLCAMKVIKKKLLIQQKVEHQLAREIRIHSKLKHINIIGFYGFFDDYENVYILLEYAVSGSVYNLIRKNNRLDEKQAVKIIKQVCEGTKHIHDYGYIQRDIKPQNTMLQFNTVKICDFGWSAQNRLRKSIAGTPLYYSPQMVRKQVYDGSVDVWAIGIMTYELIVGRIPFSIFTQDNLTEIIQKQINFPNYIDISVECKNFILNSLKKYRILRFSVKQLLQHKLMKNINQNLFDMNLYDEIKRL